MRISQSLKNWLYALAATVLGLVFSRIVISGLASIAAFSSADDSTEINFTDIYDKVADRSSVRTLSDDVVIVSVDSCNREQIAATIDAISFFEPSAVGLDLFFVYPSGMDEALIEAIEGCDNIVLPVTDGENPVKSYFYPISGKSYGCVNMASSASYDIVRDYIPLFEVDSSKVPCMAIALVQKMTGKTIDKDFRQQKIWYPAVDFEIIDYKELIDNEGFPLLEARDRIEGKAVLVGVVDDKSDVHRTPVKDEMPGIEIHAHILDTILHNKGVKEASMLLNIVVAFLCSLLFLRLHLFFKDWLDDVGEMIMRIFLFILIYIFLITGANLYIKSHCFVDFSTTLLMLGFSLTALSIIKGSLFLISMIKEKKK